MSGTVRPIVYYGADQVLHRPLQAVTSFDSALVELIDDMFASMYEAEGVGLAANQIGVDARVFVMDCPDEDGESVVAHIVNPVLRDTGDDRSLQVDNEGCLSVPGPYTDMSRNEKAIVDGFDKTGKPITLEGTGFVARCLQHETDHLNGLVYVDRLSKKRRKQLLKEAGLIV